MSSDGSRWSGGRGADIIDLDRYMRGSVKPAAPTPSEQLLQSKQRLIVDGGRAGPAARAPEDVVTFGSIASADSGLSDTFTAKTKPRRVGAGRSLRKPSSYRTGCGGSSSSLRAFRSTCEQTLREQQRQIARVAQLCELLAQRKEPPVAPSPLAVAPAVPREKRAARDSSDSSDLSSSSRSTRAERRKDKYRSNQYKTYKIIMNKLDEMNKTFESRGRPRAPCDSSSVSVSDKVVVTKPYPKRAGHRNAAEPSRRHAQVNTTSRVERGVGGEEGKRGKRCDEAELSIHTHIVDITPEHFNESISAHNVRKLESSRTESVSNAVDPGDRFHLQDPILFYSQAKKTRASRRTRSVDGVRSPRVHSAPRRAPPKGLTLCALCRSYWRCIRQYLLQQILCCPETTD